MKKLELRSLPSEGETHPKSINVNSFSQCCNLCTLKQECRAFDNDVFFNDNLSLEDKYYFGNEPLTNLNIMTCMSVKNGYFEVVDYD